MTYQSNINTKIENKQEIGKKQKAPIDKNERAIWEAIIIVSGYIYTPLWGFISLLLGIISWRVNLKRDKKIAKSFLRTGIAMMIIWIIVSSILHFYFIKPVKDDLYLSMQMNLLLYSIRSTVIEASLEENGSSSEKITCKNERMATICERIKQLTGEMPTFHHSEDGKMSCAYVKVSANNYHCVDRKDELIVQSKPSNINTSIFPGQSEYCDGETFTCPPPSNKKPRF